MGFRSISAPIATLRDSRCLPMRVFCDTIIPNCQQIKVNLLADPAKPGAALQTASVLINSLIH